MSDPRDEFRPGTRVTVKYGGPESWNWDETAYVLDVTMHHEDGWVAHIQKTRDQSEWWVRLDCLEVSP